MPVLDELNSFSTMIHAAIESAKNLGLPSVATDLATIEHTIRPIIPQVVGGTLDHLEEQVRRGTNNAVEGESKDIANLRNGLKIVAALESAISDEALHDDRFLRISDEIRVIVINLGSDDQLRTRLEPPKPIATETPEQNLKPVASPLPLWTRSSPAYHPPFPNR